MNELERSIFKPTKNDNIGFLIFVIVFPCFMTITDDDPFSLSKFAGLMVFTINSALLVYIFLFRILKKHIFTKNYRAIVIEGFLILVGAAILETIIYYLLFENETDVERTNIYTILELIFIHLLLGGVIFGFVLIKKSINSQILLLRADSLQKSNELRIIKAQVDPHFLFNNLNTLDSLIDVDVERAKIYIHRLAKLYQYLLAIKEEDVVTLEEELAFAKDYCYLIKERFGDSYQFTFKYENDDINPRKKLTPPGAIQTLFENIVKHNNASNRNPILVDILIMENKIKISNNIRSKANPTESYGIGLSNLEARYRLLSNQNIEVKVDDKYTITLPLISKINS